MNDNLTNTTVSGLPDLYYPWQASQWDKLTTVFSSGRLPHALMLSGVGGTGKTLFADTLANLVLCEQAYDNNQGNPGPVPCGRCKNCHLVQAEAHPDIRYFSPEEKSTIVKVDQIRQLNEYISKSSQQGGYKVAIIHPAEAMNTSAANALLKSLEEPSQKTLIILVVDHPGRMLPTIRSRCQVVDFPMPNHQQSMAWLSQALPESALLEDLLLLAAGSPIKAVELAGSEAVAQKQSMIADLAKVLKREVTVVSVAAKWQKYELQLVLAWNVTWLQQLIRFSMTKDAQLVKDDTLLKMIQYLAEKHSAARFYELLDKVQTTCDLVARKTNPNHQILIENVLVGWSELMQKTPA
ncbi:DNA polymerase III subunit delta' [Alkalimarinus alittae]|uniref:DNA polymerase III subunit delta' n=1 Tax=Alkalimarinus alittae TaxID=2961619 RepID=A0ABY6N786_9ALTE|nr:DNA polymerase III subunit delta' [Alkalimarinus alittae]UZE97837.1 DNA polymerase III subunit delta' [Alkalimarinus alittae]